MNCMLYFIPGEKQNVKRERLIEIGLGHAFADLHFSARGCVKGPDGGAGVIVSDTRMPADRIGYWPDRQTWTQIGWAWCGFETARPPGPDELQRTQGLDGHMVKLADGRMWQCPVAIGCEPDGGRPYNALPQISRRTPEGQWVTDRPLPVYAELWKAACKWRDAWLGTMLPAAEGQAQEDAAETAVPHVEIEFDELHEMAARCLAVNYRVGPAECSALGLFTLQAARDVLLALIDWPTWVEYLKKKAPAALSSGGPG